jgi:hypothetical protein
MSETTKTVTKAANFRAALLATVSGAVLFSAPGMSASAAADADRLIIWIEVGGAFTRVDDSENSYLPPFATASPRLPFITVSPTEVEKAAPTSWDGNAKLTFEPQGSDWTLSAAITYGRSVRHGSERQQTLYRSRPRFGQYDAYQDVAARKAESHMILDFMAGKDVGLGIFGSDEHSRLSFGLRYAQFNSESHANITYNPTNNHYAYRQFLGTLQAQRKFTGIGPAVSWDSSVGLVGHGDSGIFLDWGANGAILFGRQRVTGHHQTADFSFAYPGPPPNYGTVKTTVYQTSVPLNRSRQVIVPNLGGFAGVSWRYPNAKISIGYRADMFFGAMDGGIDAAKKDNVGFYGPFATVSIGIGG